jgi:hypothetical protein
MSLSASSMALWAGTAVSLGISAVNAAGEDEPATMTAAPCCNRELTRHSGGCKAPSFH